ncbi:MAG: hypothetical protein K2W96_28240, partial [Gemmataceae bacterium]|nr:hypothetical protein [Gemmataceae bacterium]
GEVRAAALRAALAIGAAKAALPDAEAALEATEGEVRGAAALVVLAVDPKSKKLAKLAPVLAEALLSAEDEKPIHAALASMGRTAGEALLAPLGKGPSLKPAQRGRLYRLVADLGREARIMKSGTGSKRVLGTLELLDKMRERERDAKLKKLANAAVKAIVARD